MQLSSDIVDTPPRLAATVILLRQAPAGPEVFLLQRNRASDVLGGLYVFPGGKVDGDDATPATHALLDQPVEALHQALHEPDISPATAASLYVAALREAFEECGILLAHDAEGQPVNPAEMAQRLRNGQPFGAALAQLGVQLQTRALLPWSRWITPRMPSLGMSKRFDTRFFVAAVPANQTAQHDNFEATASVWLTPRAALAQYWAGEVELAPPQIMTLAHLAPHADVASVFAAARHRPPPSVLPEPFDQDGQRVICYPGDPRHPVAERAWPGPTRLVFRNQRFEPEQGFEALFA